MPWQKNVYFRELPEDIVRQLREASCESSYSPGEMIWLQGNQVDFAGLISSGFVKMVQPTSAGTEVVMEIFGPGQVFGLLGAMDGMGCPLSAVAVGKVSLWKIPRSQLPPAIASSHQAKDLLLGRTLTRFRDANRLKGILLSGTADHRIAAVLLGLAQSFGVECGEGVTIDVPLTRQDLADMVGITQETAIRLLGRMQRQGLIASKSRRITLLRPDDLSAQNHVSL
jgi:CRP-like cAMP-binding protein